MDRSRRLVRGDPGLILPDAPTDLGTRPPGFLSLAFAPGARGTRLARQTSRAPLRVHRPFTLADGDAVVQLVHIGPGLLAGDRIDLDVSVAPGARAILVAQSATKVHRMPSGDAAEQHVRIRVASGGHLEMYPGLVIPFAGSALRQTVEVDLESGASFAWLERWTTGRDRGEASQRPRGARRLSSRFLLRVDGRLRYADALEAVGPGGFGLGVFDGRRCLASGVLVGAASLPGDAGANGLAVGCFDAAISGHYLRGLGDDALALRRAAGAVFEDWRGRMGCSRVALDRYGS